MKPRIHVKKGQVYRAYRPGKPYRTIKVVRVRVLKDRPPEAILQETTRTGRSNLGQPFRSILTANGDAVWRLIPGYQEQV